MFTTLTTDYAVTADLDAGQLVFRPGLGASGYYRPLNLFNRQGKHVRKMQGLMASFLSLKITSSPSQWEEVAGQIGPLFHIHPLQHMVLHACVQESIADWLAAQQSLQAFWDTLLKFQEAESFEKQEPERAALSAQQRRHDSALAQLAQLGLTIEDDILIVPEYQRLYEAHLLPLQLASDEHSDRLNLILNENFLKGPPLQPLFDRTTGRVELLVATGSQALLLMTVALIWDENGLTPQRCARPSCTNVIFMKGRKRYCSFDCQNAAKSQRHRNRERLTAQSYTAKA